MLLAVCAPIAHDAGVVLEVVTFDGLVVSRGQGGGRDDAHPRPPGRHRSRLRDADGGNERGAGAGRPNRVPAGLADGAAHHRHAGPPDRRDGRRRLELRAGCRGGRRLRMRYWPAERLQRSTDLAPYPRAIARSPALALPAAARRGDTIGLSIPRTGRSRSQLRPDLAPKHVARIKELTRQGFYDGVALPSRDRRLHGADRRSDRHRHRRLGATRPAGRVHRRATVRARHARHGPRPAIPNSANSQFFIMFAPAPFLDGKYTVWGRVTSGMEFVDKIKRGRSRPAQPGQDRPHAGRRRREDSTSTQHHRARMPTWPTIPKTRSSSRLTQRSRSMIELRPDLAPSHVARIKELARDGFYDGIALPPRDRRLHGADRRPDRHRHRRLGQGT